MEGVRYGGFDGAHQCIHLALYSHHAHATPLAPNNTPALSTLPHVETAKKQGSGLVAQGGVR